MTVPPSPPEGWYPDPQTTGIDRFWDGAVWTDRTRLTPPPPPVLPPPMPPLTAGAPVITQPTGPPSFQPQGPSDAPPGWAAEVVSQEHRATADRSLWKKKRFLIPAGFVGFLIVMAIVGAINDPSEDETTVASDGSGSANTLVASTVADTTTSSLVEETTTAVEPTTTAAPAATTAATEAQTTRSTTNLNPFGGDSPEDFLMPDVACFNLQEAQDEIQDHGVFFSKSEDATGDGRWQLNDSNWLVVAQSPPPGTPIGEGDAVLQVVKYGEPNDC